MIGIKTVWECPSCGVIIKQKEVLTRNTQGRCFFNEPSCSCGRKKRFNLLNVEKLNYIYKDNEGKISGFEERNKDILPQHLTDNLIPLENPVSVVRGFLSNKDGLVPIEDVKVELRKNLPESINSELSERFIEEQIEKMTRNNDVLQPKKGLLTLF